MVRRCLIAALCLGLAGPALAATPQATAPQAARDAGAATQVGEREARTHRHCLRETGTRIRSRDDQRRCSAFAGRVWSREDLERTGRVDIADALRTLDPSIR